MAKTNTNATPPSAEFKTENLGGKRVLVPLDFDRRSLAALRHAIPLARHAGGKVVLLHVVQLPVMPTPPVTGGSLGQVREAHKALTLEAKARLNDIARKIGGKGLITHQLVTVGVLWNEIVKTAKRLHCDLLVISTHGHNAITRMLSSHTAEHVVRMAPCPVLCVRA